MAFFSKIGEHVMHTISIDFKTYSSEKAVNSFQHNLRLVKIKSSINNNSYYLNDDGSTIKISDDKTRKTNKEIYKIIRDNNQKWIDDDKLKIKQSDARFPCGKKKAWNDLKHQVVGEGIIWFGKGFELEETKLDSVKKFRESRYTPEENEGVVYKSPSQSDKSKIMAQAIANVKSYFKNKNAEAPTNFVLHSDEKGQSHLHFNFRNSDLETGRGLNIQYGLDGVRAQDAIAENMNQFGLERGIPNSEKKEIKKIDELNPTDARLNHEIVEGLRSQKGNEELKAQWGAYWMQNKDALLVELEDIEFMKVFKARSLRQTMSLIDKIEASDYDPDGEKAQTLFDGVGEVQSASTPKQVLSASNKLARKAKAVQRTPKR